MTRVKKFALEQGYSGARYLNKWNGYNVYEPTFSRGKIAFVGLPLVILENNGVCRMSTPAEAMEILNA